MGTLALIIGVILFWTLVWLLIKGGQDKGLQKLEENVIGTSVRRPWTTNEFIVLAFYVLYEKDGDNDLKLVETIASGMCRSFLSVQKKISIFNNIEETEEHLHVNERKVYFDLKNAGKGIAEKRMDIAVESIINLYKQ